MKNDLGALNNYLFEQLERLQDDSLSSEDLEREIVRSNAVISVAETIIHNGELALKAQRHIAEYNGTSDKVALPKMLEAGK